MRELTMNEIEFVSGGADECKSEGEGNEYAGVKDTKSIGKDLINIYEGVVEATSHIIERVANAL